MLGISYVIVHPGAYTTSSEARGLRRIIRTLDAIHQETDGMATRCLLETTTGQGTTLGGRFEHLATILNDSLREFGSRVDRHAHIGHGHLGVEPFGQLLRDRRFRKVPMYLETPKGNKKGIDWDMINLRLLRRLTGH